MEQPILMLVVVLAANNGATPSVGDVVMVSETAASAATQTGPTVTTVTAVTSALAFTLASTALGVAGDFHIHIIARPQSVISRCSTLGLDVNVYSFALKPEEHQPSGTCNFSRIDTAWKCSSEATVSNIYAVNYNVLRVMSGMGGLAYSN